MNNTCVAFGCFDGVHLGHRAVINKLIETSKKGLTSVVISLEQCEEQLKGRKILSTEAEKERLLGKEGPEILVSYKMEDCLKKSPEHFIKEVLVDRLGAKAIVAGTCDRNLDILKDCAKKYGFELIECETVHMDGEPITAERISRELAEGSLAKANELLGHPHLLLGEVMHGKALGRTVGMPTANLGFCQYKQLPADGVFGTLSEIDEKNVKGLTNIGQRPSVDNYNYVTVETFLLDYAGDLYGKTIALEIYAYIRGVKKFNCLSDVKSQVNQDIESIRNYLDRL